MEPSKSKNSFWASDAAPPAKVKLTLTVARGEVVEVFITSLENPVLKAVTVGHGPTLIEGLLTHEKVPSDGFFAHTRTAADKAIVWPTQPLIEVVAEVELSGLNVEPEVTVAAWPT
jgi:hypothetical protein